jgi:hypothetical protein
MKTLLSSSIVFFLSAAASLCLAASTNSLPATNSAPSAKPAAAPVPEVIPQSIFVIPSTPGPARDPFYPDRLIQDAEVKAQVVTNARPSSVTCLVLKGLSGVEPNPLAIINGRTMARGEDAEIVTDCGRLLVHCVDITTNSAIVEVGGDRRELHLRSDF